MNIKQPERKGIVEQYQAARMGGVPLLAIETLDSEALVQRLLDAAVPAVGWDYCSGMRPLNKGGEPLVAQIVVEDPEMGRSDPTVGNPAAAIAAANAMNLHGEDGHVVFLSMAHRFFEDVGFVQGLRNVRDPYKADGRTIVLMGETMRLPLELRGHVVVLDEPLPDDQQLLDIATEIYSDRAAEMTSVVTASDLAKVAETLRGTFTFSAETLAAMALRVDGFDQQTLELASRRQIEETLGLSVDKGGETFDDIGGLSQVKRMGRLRFEGKRRPRLVVRIEELEKAMAGAKGDLSGTSTDILQVLLSEMEDNDWSGLLAFGVAGGGKSYFAKSLANTFSVLPMRLDVNACKGSLVGQSEQNIRAAMKVIKAIGGDRAFFVASMNRMDIPPELKRRFRAGVWYFDTPDDEERAAIWAIQFAKYGLDGADWREVDEPDMTGADIRNICEYASDTGLSLRETMDFIVLMKHADPASIRDCRAQADGKYSSASKPGRYQQSRAEAIIANSKPRRRTRVGV
jgi:hypothetical protein